MTTEATVATQAESGHPTLHELSTAGKLIKTTLGVGLFMGWLLLFVFGMSLSSNDYRSCIFENDNLNFRYLLLYAATFTPTNAAVLASLAGILGGFSSNLAASNKYHHLRPTLTDPTSADFESYMYMTENPLVSMLRGFITYLIFIAGSYLTNFTSAIDTTNAAGFSGLNASSYFKFAVSVSLLAYLAGYDPSRMTGLVNSISFTRKDTAPIPPPTQEKVVTHQTLESETFKVSTAGIPPSPNGNGQAARSA